MATVLCRYTLVGHRPLLQLAKFLLIQKIGLLYLFVVTDFEIVKFHEISFYPLNFVTPFPEFKMDSDDQLWYEGTSLMSSLPFIFSKISCVIFVFLVCFPKF